MYPPMQVSACICMRSVGVYLAQEGKTVLWLRAPSRKISGVSVPSAGTHWAWSPRRFYPLRAIAAPLAELEEPVTGPRGVGGCGAERAGAVARPGTSRSSARGPVPVAQGGERSERSPLRTPGAGFREAAGWKLPLALPGLEAWWEALKSPDLGLFC